MRNDTKRKLGSLGFTAGLVLFGHWLDFFLMIRPGVKHTAHELSGHGHGHGDHGAHETAGHGAHEVAGHGGHEVAHAAGHHAESVFEMGYTMPGFLELGTFIGFLSLFFFYVLGRVSSTSLTSSADPYIQESIHHHT